MTDMEQALTISSIIFGVVMLTQYGRRRYSLHKLIQPVLTVGLVGFFYLRGMPGSGADWAVYGVGAAIGLGFGIVTNAATGVERGATGRVFTRCGPAFLTAWVALVAARIVFIALADHNDAFRSHLGRFMVEHGIVQDAIAPFFVIMALVTVVSRVALVAARARNARPVEAGTELGVPAAV